MPNIVTTANTF